MSVIHPQPRCRRGLSLVEAMMCSLLVAMILVATMRLVGGVARSGQVLSDRATAAEVAHGLAEEILSKSYTDPSLPGGFGLESGETIASKANYDDVDDYSGWSQSYAFTGRTAVDNLVATVTVTRATLATPSSDAATETGLKHVKVTVTKQSRVLALREVWKANAQ